MVKYRSREQTVQTMSAEERRQRYEIKRPELEPLLHFRL